LPPPWEGKGERRALGGENMSNESKEIIRESNEEKKKKVHMED